MAIAFLSDVHGNLAALEAVLAELDRRGPERVFALGDLVGRGPEPEGVVRALLDRGIPCLKGNWDGWVAGAEGWDARPKRRAHVETARALMSDATIHALAQFPERIEVRAGERKVLLVHGSPRDPVELLRPETPDETLSQAVAGVEADIIGVAHSHRSFVRRVGRMWIVNGGTVGYPFDGDPRASFAWIEANAEPPRVEIVRVPYRMHENLRAVRRAVRRGHLAPELAARYRRALLGDIPEERTRVPGSSAGLSGWIGWISEPTRLALGDRELSLAPLRSLAARRALRGALAVGRDVIGKRKARALSMTLEPSIALLTAMEETASARRGGHDERLEARLAARARRQERRFLREREAHDADLGLAILDAFMSAHAPEISIEFAFLEAKGRASRRLERDALRRRLRTIRDLTRTDVVTTALSPDELDAFRLALDIETAGERLEAPPSARVLGTSLAGIEARARDFETALLVIRIAERSGLEGRGLGPKSLEDAYSEVRDLRGRLAEALRDFDEKISGPR